MILVKNLSTLSQLGNSQGILFRQRFILLRMISREYRFVVSSQHFKIFLVLQHLRSHSTHGPGPGVPAPIAGGRGSGLEAQDLKRTLGSLVLLVLVAAVALANGFLRLRRVFAGQRRWAAATSHSSKSIFFVAAPTSTLAFGNLRDLFH